MTKKVFETNDQIGKYKIDEFAGTNAKGGAAWWVITEVGESKIVTEKKLRAELAKAEWTPAKIYALSSRAYDELCEEIGIDAVEEILGASAQKPNAPDPQQQREIASKWWEAHPQIPKTRANVTLFDKYLAEMPNPTFTSSDFDRCFIERFYEIEFNPKAVDIEGHGDGIRGRAAIQKLTANQVAQIQKSFPVAPPEKDKLTLDEVLVEIGNHAQSSDKFVQDLNYLDRKLRNSPHAVPASSVGSAHYGGTHFVFNEPRPRSPHLAFDDTPVTVTVAEINAMDGKTYGEQMRNPRFAEAVNALYGRLKAKPA